MHKSFTTTAVNILAAVSLLLGNALAQQTPAATTQPAAPSAATPAKAQTPTAKRPATAAQSATPLALKTQKDKFSYSLAVNKGKEGVVTLPSGLQYKILKEGTGPKPAATDTVVCNYRGTLVNGTEF